MSEKEQPRRVIVDKNISRESIEKLIAHLEKKESTSSKPENQPKTPKESTTEN